MTLYDKLSRRIVQKKNFYRNEVKIGSGTFGTVFRAERIKGGNNNKYALKKYKYSTQPLHATTVRELKALRMLTHSSIISLEEIIVEKYGICAVFPYYGSDLARWLHDGQLEILDIQEIFTKVLEGVFYMHRAGIIHRDLKTANILIERKSEWDGMEQGEILEYDEVKRRKSNLGKMDNINNIEDTNNTEDNNRNANLNIRDDNFNNRDIRDNWVVKICDFGMARVINKEMTPGVVTLWYRAPELLLGCTRYGPEIDVWSLGCILYEMLNGVPIFRGGTEVEQLDNIIRRCGSIENDSMPAVEKYSLYKKYNLIKGERNIKNKEYIRRYNSTNSSSNISKDIDTILDLVDKMLILDPERRIKIEDIFLHEFIKND